MNVLENFRSIAGVYSVTAIKGTRHSEWSCSIYRGGKRIGTAKRERVPTEFRAMPSDGSLHVNVTIEDVNEEFKLTCWADQAGPFGFENINTFITSLMDWVFILKAMRNEVKQGHLVAYESTRVDVHNMPKDFRTSKIVADAKWISAYMKNYPHMQVVNHQLEV